MEKLCVFCEHLDFSTFGCYGRYPDPALFKCGKRHTLLQAAGVYNGFGKGYAPVYSAEDMRTILETAKECPDYKQVKL